MKTEDAEALDIHALQTFLREHPRATLPDYFGVGSSEASDNVMDTSTTDVEKFLRLAHLLGALTSFYEVMAAQADDSVRLYADSYRKAAQLDLRIAIMANRVCEGRLPSPLPSSPPQEQVEEQEPGRTLIDDVLGTSET